MNSVCPDSVIAREIPLNILNRMIINFGSVTDYSEVFSKLMNDILSFLSESDGDKIYKLSCQSLALYMKYLPEIAGSRINDIEEILVKELNNPYGEVIEAIGDCFAALPTCLLRYHKTNSIQYKDTWCNLIKKFLNTMHLSLNNLMNLSEDMKEYVDVSDLPLFVIPSSDDIPVAQIDSFKSLCQCMAKVMSSESDSVRLPITDVLEALLRIFQVEKKIKDSNTAVRGYFILGFPHLLYGAYVVIEALILNFQMMEQSHNFMAFIRMSLDAMEQTFSQSSVDEMRVSTWKLVNVWLKQYGMKGSYELVKEKSILQKILLDIDIEGKPLKSSNIEEKNQKPNANKIFACTHALKVLKSLLEVGSAYMEKSSLNKISSALLRISKLVLRHVSPKKIYPFPYSDDKCRKMLFDVLQTSLMFCDPSLSRYFIEAFYIFKAASKDPSTKVTRICHRFRKLSRYYLNPRKPPPEAVKFSNHNTLNIQQPVMEHLKADWIKGVNFPNGNAASSDDQMDDGKATHVQDENAHSERIESEHDLMPIEQEADSHMNHDYRIIIQSSQSVGAEESVDDSDIEPTYISTDSNPQRLGINDSSRVDSFGLQSCSNQYTNETRTDRQAAEYIVPNLTNNVENNIEHVSFVEKSAKKVQMENGHWKKEDSESDEDESDMDEEGDEEANEENSGCDETSDGKRSPEFDEERPNKRQKFIEEEEDMEDEDIVVNNQLLSDEETEGNHVHVSEEEEGNSENSMENTVVNAMENTIVNAKDNTVINAMENTAENAVENEDESIDDGVPSLKDMFGDYCPQEAHEIR
ncbi:hypothetical protein HNY73_003996 [Argiope bruennichi]|uniref:Uncharacterized protein n=1 Tax=Argiope bruennichi TaxID=94029 RepID=A0A8T0FPY2_ARGBR|nr:hypothetical protein HNY73_003996 [Argiope bruennichi]